MRVARPVAALIVGTAGMVGLAFLSLAQPANHPQIEMARSAVSQLEAGATPASVVPPRDIDIATSTDPFVIVTNSKHDVVASSASLSGKSVLPPPGVFDSVVRNGEDRVTWQPAPGVRSWIVVDSYQGGFVIAGRSPSDREQTAYQLVLWCSIAAIAVGVVAGLGLLLLRLDRGGMNAKPR